MSDLTKLVENILGERTMSNTETDTPRIYVTSLSDYNAGRLHGRWIEAIDADVIREEIAEMLAESPEPMAEEWAIHDSDNFGGLQLGGISDVEQVAELGQLISKYGRAFAAYADNVSVDHATEEDFEEAYCGEWESKKAYARELFDEIFLHKVPGHIQCYIDYEAFSRDLFTSDYFSVESDSGVYVFRNC